MLTQGSSRTSWGGGSNKWGAGSLCRGGSCPDPRGAMFPMSQGHSLLSPFPLSPGSLRAVRNHF